MIANGVLKPGDKLTPEPVLMKQFGAWRSPIRKAVEALALIGLIKVHPGQGTCVAVYLKHEQANSIGFMMGIGRNKVRKLVPVSNSSRSLANWP
jgi:GntR family transcriptional repressor for pyruvate dehydrogenase complex